jgi:catechol 2,3-dioxygenase-like lactoylglutathione lyase family enzyme
VSDGVQALLRIGRNTADLDRAVAFYRDALGFHVDDANPGQPAWTRLAGVCDPPSRCTRLSLGAQQIELTEFTDAAPYPSGSTSCDLWFQHCAIVVSDMDEAWARVMHHGAEPITRDGPQILPPSTGSVIAFKFRDPDGHPLELLHFPAGTGDPCWQSVRGEGPMLGIDHSAISVGDVARSIRFYERLGLHIAARGVNRGVEQQRLDDLANVDVDVIALQAPTRTPHVELLGYRRPRGRGNASTDITSVAADRLEFSMQNLHAARDNLRALDATIRAQGSSDRANDSQAVLLRDPDGHCVVLTPYGNREQR